MQELIASENPIEQENVSLNDIIEYLKNVDGSTFGEKTFAPVYEHGKSIKEIDLVWAPNIESMQKKIIVHWHIHSSYDNISQMNRSTVRC